MSRGVIPEDARRGWLCGLFPRAVTYLDINCYEGADRSRTARERVRSGRIPPHAAILRDQLAHAPARNRLAGKKRSF